MDFDRDINFLPTIDLGFWLVKMTWKTGNNLINDVEHHLEHSQWCSAGGDDSPRQDETATSCCCE